MNEKIELPSVSTKTEAMAIADRFSLVFKGLEICHTDFSTDPQLKFRFVGRLEDIQIFGSITQSRTIFRFESRDTLYWIWVKFEKSELPQMKSAFEPSDPFSAFSAFFSSDPFSAPIPRIDWSGIEPGPVKIGTQSGLDAFVSKWQPIARRGLSLCGYEVDGVTAHERLEWSLSQVEVYGLTA